MCGIVGIINHKAKKGVSTSNFGINNTFNNMLWADTLRGRDGCGVMQLTKDVEFKVLKVKGDFNDLDDEKESSEIFNWADCAFFTVGHNRSATRGSISAANAHPFEEGNIILVHNGTLTHYPKKYEHKDKFLDVDSRALAEMIDQLGIEKAVNEFNGAYACVWFDKTDKSLNFARNSDRPLGIVEYDGGVMLASEGYLAAWAGSRNGLSIKTIKQIPVNVHHKILYDDITKVIEMPYTPKPPKVYSPGFTGYGYDSDYIDDDWYDKAVKEKEVPKKGGREKERFRGVRSTTGGLYCVGDEIIVQLSGYKTSPRSSFYSTEGCIQEPAAEEIRHKVIANTALSNTVLQDFTQLYQARIASILESKTGFFLITARDLEPIDNDSDEKSTDMVVSGEIIPKGTTNVVPISGPTGSNYKQCDACDVYVIKDEIKVISKQTTIGDTGTFIKIVSVCEHCASMLDGDITDLFDRTYDKKVKKFKHGGKAA